MKVLFLALTATRARMVKSHSHFLLQHGVDVSLVTTNPDPWVEEGLDERVTMYTLRDGEGRHPLTRVERVVVFRAPGAVLGRLARVAPALRRVERSYERLAQAFHRKVYSRLYRVVRPYVLWRVARRDVLPRLDLRSVTEVVIADSHAIPLGWHLARRHPDLKISFSLDRATYSDATAPGEQEAGEEEGRRPVTRAADV